MKKTGKTEESARETIFPPVKKIEKMGKNDFHGHFWFSRGKKKNTAKIHVLGHKLDTLCATCADPNLAFRDLKSMFKVKN